MTVEGLQPAASHATSVAVVRRRYFPGASARSVDERNQHTCGVRTDGVHLYPSLRGSSLWHLAVRPVEGGGFPLRKTANPPSRDGGPLEYGWHCPKRTRKVVGVYPVRLGWIREETFRTWGVTLMLGSDGAFGRQRSRGKACVAQEATGLQT
jgi:hypothetical protein